MTVRIIFIIIISIESYLHLTNELMAVATLKGGAVVCVCVLEYILSLETALLKEPVLEACHHLVHVLLKLGIEVEIVVAPDEID